MQDPALMQRMTDLRMKILENERLGRPRHHEINPQELSAMIDELRRHRAPLGAKGGRAAGASKGRKRRDTGDLDTKLKALGMDFD